MPRNIIRLIAKFAVVVGVFLLVRVIYHAASGSLLAQLFPESQQSWANNLYAIGLSIPIPLLRAAAPMAASALDPNRLVGGGYLRLLAWGCPGD